MPTNQTRRGFLQGGAITMGGFLAAGAAQPSLNAQEPIDPGSPGEGGPQGHEPSAAGHSAGAHEDVRQDSQEEFPRMRPGRGGPIGSATDRGRLVGGRRNADEPPVPVVMPDVPKLPWTMRDGVKEYRLVAEVVRRELLPGMTFDFWGYNGSMPGPMIEAVQGDRVRIVVQNNLPEPTTVHWHGLELPNAMDGVQGVTQNPIEPGKEFVYEFDLHQDGTFFYHSHGPMQEIMGMMGLFIIHPLDQYTPTVDHDFGLIMQEFPILPQNTVPDSMSEEFNFFTINGRAGPLTTPMVVQLGDRVRIRMMNLSAMHAHPMHLHGHTFWVTGNEAGRIPESLWMPGNTVLVGVGAVRDVEFVANNPGDWLLHCHILHHMMNHMVPMVGPMELQMEGHGNGNQDHEQHEKLRGMRDLADRLAVIQQGGVPEPLVRTGPVEPKRRVPGYPQDMMGMMGDFSPQALDRVRRPETAGMRRNWMIGTHGMKTVVRVLPPDLYEKVMAGEEVPPGASVPGAGPGQMPGHAAHEH